AWMPERSSERLRGGSSLTELVQRELLNDRLVPGVDVLLKLVGELLIRCVVLLSELLVPSLRHGRKLRFVQIHERFLHRVELGDDRTVGRVVVNVAAERHRRYDPSTDGSGSELVPFRPGQQNRGVNLVGVRLRPVE